MDQLNLPPSATDNESGANDAERTLRLTAFFESLLRAGMQSFSHMLAVVERYHVIALQLTNNHAARCDVVRIVSRVFTRHPQTVMIVLDRFQKYDIVDGTAIVEWSMDATSLPFFRQAFFRDVLRNSVSWTVRHAAAQRIDICHNVVRAAQPPDEPEPAQQIGGFANRPVSTTLLYIITIL